MLDLFDSYPWILNLMTFVFGVLSALIANYLKFASDISYIKGQLSEVLKFTDGISDLSEKHVKLETDFYKTAANLDSAVVRIKRIEAKFLGETYG